MFLPPVSIGQTSGVGLKLCHGILDTSSQNKVFSALRTSILAVMPMNSSSPSVNELSGLLRMWLKIE